MIGWLIEVYDCTASERFPLKRKHYRFDYSRATEAEIADVLCLVNARRQNRPLHASNSTPGKWTETWSLGDASFFTSKEILKYRHLFVPDELRASEGYAASDGVRTVSLASESYFEDENELPISNVKMWDCEARRRFGNNARAIVYDEPESILRRAPAEPIRPELWNQGVADLLAQFFEIHRQLTQSPWLRDRCVVARSANGECNSILPVENNCQAVVLPFRQLYSKDGQDDLFNRACKVHNRHCPDAHPTCDWVQHYSRSFNAFLQKPSGFPPMQCDLSVRRYLDAFAYGAGLVHASNKKEEPVKDLDALLAAHPRELVVMTYHHILRTLLWNVSMAVPVICQNTDHWMNDLKWASPRKQSLQGLFR